MRVRAELAVERRRLRERLVRVVEVQEKEVAPVRVELQPLHRFLEVVLAADDARARDAIGKAVKIYGPHLGAGLEEHGVWGSPDGVIERLQRRIDQGCTHFVMEFFGRDTREPARLFAEKVLPAFHTG